MYFGSQWTHKTAYGRISTKLSWGPYCRKTGQFTATLQFGTQIYSKPWRFLHKKQQRTREWKKLEKISAWNLTKVRSKSEVIDEARTKGIKVHFASLMDICHLKNAELETKAPKIQRSSCTPWWYCKRQFWISRSFHWTRIISITNDSSKSHGYHIQTARVCSTSSGCSICLYPGKKWKMPQNYWKFQIGVFRHLDSSTTTQMVKIMVQYGRNSLFLLSEICTALAGFCYGKGNLRTSYGSTVGKRFVIGNAYSYTFKRGYSYLWMWMTKKLAGKKQNINPMWKVFKKEVDWGELTSFLDHWKPGGVLKDSAK